MKRVPILMLLIMAFVSFATMDSFADSSPPGVEISINYELPQGIELNFENQVAQVWQAIELNNDEGRIAVPDCDLKCWPGNENSINIYATSLVNKSYGVLETNNINTDFIWAALPLNNRYILENQHNENRFETEVLSLFYTSNVFAIA